MFSNIKPWLLKAIWIKLIALSLTLGLAYQLYLEIKILSGFDNHAIVAINSAPKAHKAQALKLDTAFFGYFIPSNINDAKIKPSSLNLELVGIIFAPVAALSHIIIRTPDGRELNFGVGAKLPGGGVIKRISASGAVLLYHGVLECLNLTKKSLS